MIKNKGLTPHRKKANRNPRVKKREAYHKAVVARKGQVRESVGGAAGDGYGGELTGIKSNLSRSRRLST
jgi:U3 small nucleolar RNA-associated protein 3